MNGGKKKGEAAPEVTPARPRLAWRREKPG